MLTFAVMLLGVLAGRFFPAAHKSKNEKLQLACTLALIFAMGISLGGGGRFFASLAFIGGQSLLFCLVPTVGSRAARGPSPRRTSSRCPPIPTACSCSSCSPWA